MEELLKNKLEKQIKSEIKISKIELFIFIVAWICWTIYVIFGMKKEPRDEYILMVICTVGLAIGIVVFFYKFVLSYLKDLKNFEIGQYEKLTVRVIRRKKRLCSLGGYRIEVICIDDKTGEEIKFDYGADEMKENEIYFVLRTEHSKLFVFEHLDKNMQEN